MNNFIFQNATRVYFGRGCVKEYLACLTKSYSAVMLAYGEGSIRKNGIYEEVTGILRSAGKRVVEFPGIGPNPTYQKVQEGARLAREQEVELILAVGGGSVMDCSKAISLAARYQGDVWADFWEHPGVLEASPLPMGCIVTAAGTGSECNGGAVITNAEKKVKTGRDYPKLNPLFALMDPSYTGSVPAPYMAAGGMDTVGCILETYFSQPDTANVSDDLMEGLLRGVVRDLRAAIQNPQDYTARSNLLWASAMAGNRVIKMGKQGDFPCHRLAYQLEAYTGCRHGFGMAVLLPVYYRYVCRERAAKLARFVWGIAPEGFCIGKTARANGKEAEKMEEQSEKYLFEEMPVARAVATLAIPTMISQVVTMIYNLADTFFIGQIGEPTMVAAVSLVSPWFNLLTALGNLFGLGGSSLISRMMGAQSHRNIKHVAVFSVWGGAAVTLLFSLATYLGRSPLLYFLGASPDTYGYAESYLFWVVVLGGVPTMASLTLGHLLRSEGHARQASAGMMFGGILNVVLDPVLIFGFHLDVAGAAIATAFSNAASVVFFVVQFRRLGEKTAVSLNP